MLIDYDTGGDPDQGVPALKGNPIQDTKGSWPRSSVRDRGATWRSWALAPPATRPTCSGVGQADVNIVETVAHMMSAVRFFGDVDVICDIGGQDIKVLFMENGDIKNFRLRNQCSAGNGMLLQAMADQFGVPVITTPTSPSRPTCRRSSATAAPCSSTPIA